MKLLSELERLVKEVSDSAFGRNPERFIYNDKTNTVQKSFREPKIFFNKGETVKQNCMGVQVIHMHALLLDSYNRQR